MSLFTPSANKQYENKLLMLSAHVNNLPVTYDLSNFTEAFYSIIYELNNLFIENPQFFRRFWQEDLPKCVESWIKNISIYLFLRQKIQINCVKMNNRYVFININDIYLNGNNEDKYYEERFRPETPSYVEDVFDVIQDFVKQFSRSGFLNVGGQKTVTIDRGNKCFDFIYTTNFFVEGNRICLYKDEEQALLDVIQSVDYNGIVNGIFENPVLSGKNIYDVCLLATTAQDFLLACLQDKQWDTPLFKNALIDGQLDARNSLSFLASVITNDLPNLYRIRDRLNRPNSEEWKEYKEKLTENLKERFLAPLPTSLLKEEKEDVLLSSDNWHSNWAALTLMDVMGLPANLVGESLVTDACLPLDQTSDQDYQIETYLVYKPIPTTPLQGEPSYRPIFQIKITTDKPLAIASTLEAVLPTHLEKFLTQDLRTLFGLWTNQMFSLGGGLSTTDGSPLQAFLNQITVAQFFNDVLGDQELGQNFSRRLGFYFWRALCKSSVVSAPLIKTSVQNFLKEKMYLVDADMA